MVALIATGIFVVMFFFLIEAFYKVEYNIVNDLILWNTFHYLVLLRINSLIKSLEYGNDKIIENQVETETLPKFMLIINPNLLY